jgi:signal transduction histidine kinase
MSLVTQFLLLSAIVLLFGAIIIGWWINREIEDQVVNNSLDITAVFVDSTIAPHLWELDSLDQISALQKNHLNQLLMSSLNHGDFIAFHIAKPSGELVYSSMPITPNMDITTPGLRVAQAGQVYSHITDHIDFAPPELQHNHQMIETYFPVRSQDGQRIIAIASFYQSLDETRSTILEAQLQGWAVVGTATFLMYVLLFGLMKRGNDTIEQQKLALAESRQLIQQAAVRAAEVNEDTMRRLGADLHDGPAQDLGIALMRMEPLRQALAQPTSDNLHQTADPEVIAYDLNLIQTALHSSLNEIRNMAAGLRMPDLHELDLAGTILKATSDYSRKTGRLVAINGPNTLPGDEALKSAVYRIVQESLNNGHIHANPTEQYVTYFVDQRYFTLTVGDDGNGFDQDALPQDGRRRHLGLAGLKERAEILGGRLVIHSELKKGTTVEVIIPLSTAVGDEAESGE